MEEEDKSNIDTFFMPKNEVHETMLLIETKSIPKIITQWQFIDLTQKMRKMHNKNIITSDQYMIFLNSIIQAKIE